MRRRALPLALLAAGGCASLHRDHAPPVEPEPAPTSSGPRAVAYEVAASKDGVALAVGEVVRINSTRFDIDVHVELRLLDVVATRTTPARPGATLELRLVRADGSDVPFTRVIQPTYGNADRHEGRGWTGFLPEGDEPTLFFDTTPPDERVPHGWRFRVTVKPADPRHARFVFSGEAIDYDK